MIKKAVISIGAIGLALSAVACSAGAHHAASTPAASSFKLSNGTSSTANPTGASTFTEKAFQNPKAKS